MDFLHLEEYEEKQKKSQFGHDCLKRDQNWAVRLHVLVENQDQSREYDLYAEPQKVEEKDNLQILLNQMVVVPKHDCLDYRVYDEHNQRGVELELRCQ